MKMKFRLAPFLNWTKDSIYYNNRDRNGPSKISKPNLFVNETVVKQDALHSARYLMVHENKNTFSKKI